MSNCIDLRIVCKERRWKWHYEESFKAERMRSTNPSAPWYVEVLCKNGTIYPISEFYLAACVEGRPNMPSRLKKIDGVSQHQGNVVFKFHALLLDDVAKVMRPRRKRRVSPEAIARWRATLAELHAKRYDQGKRSGSESPNSEGDR